MTSNHPPINSQPEQDQSMSDRETSVSEQRAVSPQSSALAAVVRQVSNNDPDQKLEWPPGCIGETARYVYNSAPRPVREVAIVAALGLHAGICGKAWTIEDTGLNLYITLVARSAIGKEAMHSGISSLISAIGARFPQATNFVNFTDFASGPALIKTCASQSSFVQVAGEWGHKLKRLSRDDGRDPAMASLRMVMTNLYSKSGPQSVAGGINYSQQEGNIASIAGIAYSMIGETTPETFYTALSTSMMADGFMSRLNVVEYTGERPPRNEARITRPPEWLVDWLTGMAQFAYSRSSTGLPPISVQWDDEADDLFRDFDFECDKEINSSTDESYRQGWNRATLKVKRISALLAVGDGLPSSGGAHNGEPGAINMEHVRWALMLVRREIALFVRRQAAGDIGEGDHTRRKKLCDFLRRCMLEKDVPNKFKDRKLKDMMDNGIVTHRHIVSGMSNQTAFTSHRLGQSEALKLTIRDLLDNGILMEMQKDKLVSIYSEHGKAYRIVAIPE
jgi:hypothetical protein